MTPFCAESTGRVGTPEPRRTTSGSRLLAPGRGALWALALLVAVVAGCERRREVPPARPEGRLSSGKWACDEFLRHVRGRRPEAAYGLLSPMVREQLPLAGFEERLELFPPLAESTDHFFYESGELYSRGALIRVTRKVEFACFHEAEDTARPEYSVLSVVVGGVPVVGLGVHDSAQAPP